jgi:predicted GIY-YIG superfamily endonuclease
MCEVIEMEDAFAMTAEEIVETAKGFSNPFCVVYFICDSKEILYVGQTIDFHGRIHAHLNGKLRNVDVRVACIRCKREHLNAVEAYYISKFQPRHNIMGRYFREQKCDTIEFKPIGLPAELWPIYHRSLVKGRPDGTSGRLVSSETAAHLIGADPPRLSSYRSRGNGPPFVKCSNGRILYDTGLLFGWFIESGFGQRHFEF